MADKVANASVTENEFTLPKKLIVCCDGTWMDSDNGWVKGSWGKAGHLQNPTNVTRLARAISSEDDHHHPQIIYYQAGVGTGIGLWEHLVGGGTGMGLAEHIREAYAFLVNNYRENDKERPGVPADAIFLVGFSRGAFTARSIGGLIGAVGILKRRTMPHFYEIFSDWENAGNKHYKPLFFDSYFKDRTDKKVKPADALAKDNKKIDVYMKEYFKLLLELELTEEATIQCIGVWDTVGSLGIPINPVLQRLLPFLPSYFREYSWFDTGLDKHVKNGFQALALDEHRYPFSPTLWERKKGLETNLKQVWFPGAHSNVGGSYSDSGIADITLAWMMDQLSGNTTKHPNGFVHHDWIKFDERYIENWQGPQLKLLEEQKKPEYRGWGMGYVYESCYFPQSFLGSTVRSPGRYNRTIYETGKIDPNSPLENTNEFVHACVRARTDLGGMAVQDDWNQLFPNSMDFWPVLTNSIRSLLGRPPKLYKPQRKGGPLEDWRLEDGHKSHNDPNMEIDMTPHATPNSGKEIAWVYQGKKPCLNKELPEDTLGPIELKLLERDQKYAEKIMVSNNAWHWSKSVSSSGHQDSHTV